MQLVGRSIALKTRIGELTFQRCFLSLAGGLVKFATGHCHNGHVPPHYCSYVTTIIVRGSPGLLPRLMPLHRSCRWIFKRSIKRLFRLIQMWQLEGRVLAGGNACSIAFEPFRVQTRDRQLAWIETRARMSLEPYQHDLASRWIRRSVLGPERIPSPAGIYAKPSAPSSEGAQATQLQYFPPVTYSIDPIAFFIML